MAEVLSVSAEATTPGSLEGDRVRQNTDPAINRQIDQRIERTIRLYANQPAWIISERLDDLDREWDIERMIETNASSLALAGLFLGTVSSRKWFALPAGVAGFLLLHGPQGGCPPVPALRKLGVRTREEI